MNSVQFIKKKTGDESGINMVDLMMWLVIAALLLAAAIQGIGYYQRAALLNNMKSDAYNAGTNTLTVASMDGNVNLDAVQTALTDTKWSAGNTYAAQEAETGSTSKPPYIRVSHPQITDKDVIYLFKACADDYDIGVNVVPKDSNVILETCGITSGGGTGTPTAPTTPAPPVMTTVWDNTLTGCPSANTIVLPVNGAVTGTVDWGDGSITPLTTKNHVYATPGIRTITINGTFAQWGESSLGYQYLSCLTDVTEWGNTGTTNLNHGFYRATNLNSISNIPAGIISMQSTLRGASKFNGNISNWDTSQVTDMSLLFLGASQFNQNISGWDTSKVKDMNQTFSGSAFNQPLSNWKTGNVENMSSMFKSTPFAADIRGWNTSKVKNMSNMFYDAKSFNSPLNWDTSQVQDFSGMFSGASEFNQPLLNWNTSSATTMDSMFSGASKFNNDISSFTTVNVKNMANMFSGARLFNQPLAHFNTGNVTSMSGMFSNANRFNKDITQWDTRKVTSMYTMFSNATDFRQDISKWNVTLVTNHLNFAINSFPPAYLPVWVA